MWRYDAAENRQDKFWHAFCSMKGVRTLRAVKFDNNKNRYNYGKNYWY